MATEKRLGALDEPGLKEIRPGVWQLRVFVGRDANGRPVQKSRTVDSGTGKVNAGVREARAALTKMKSEVEENGGTKRTVTEMGMTVAQLLDRYIDHCQQQGRSPTTIHEYRRLADKVLVPRFGAMRLDRLEHEHLDALYAELKTRLAPNSIRRIHSLMSASLKFGQKKRLVNVNHNPAQLASPPPRFTEEAEAPTVEQVQAVFTAAEAIDLAFCAMVVLAALGGARRGELCALRWSDVDFDTATLTIRASVYEKVNAADGPRFGIKDTKTRQNRRIGLNATCMEALSRHRMAVWTLADSLGVDVPENAFIFSDSPQGSEPWRPGLVTERYAKVAKAVGLDITRFHALRHFMATDMIADGADIPTVSHRLGHSDPSMTLRTYAHALEQRDRELTARQGAKFTLGTGDER